MTNYEKLKIALDQRFGNKPIYKGDQDIKRWFDENEVVQFRVNKYTNFNVEFVVNNDTSHLIWLSQLASFFFNAKTMSIGCGEIVKKDQEKIIPCFSTRDDLIRILTKNRYRIKVETDLFKLKKEKMGHINTLQDILDFNEFLKGIIECGNIDEAVSYFESGRCYTLYEI